MLVGDGPIIGILIGENISDLIIGHDSIAQ